MRKPNDVSERKRIADRYATFAADEARGSSEIYQRLAQAVAGSADVLEFLATLPAERRQPNLFLAAVRHLFGVPNGERQLIDIVRRKHESIRELMLSRTTQTNEPARCAVLLPLLARLPQPLALLEVGASAGLCLLPDRYGYDYGMARLEPPTKETHSPPVFECRASGAVPIPSALPIIAWRAGIDLNPIDVNATAETAWLETLVWPGQEERVHRLRAALAVAQAEPPRIVKGNLVTDLAALMAEAPECATLVVLSHGRAGLCGVGDSSRAVRTGNARIKSSLDQQRGSERVPRYRKSCATHAAARSLSAGYQRPCRCMDRPAWRIDRMVRPLMIEGQ